MNRSQIATGHQRHRDPRNLPLVFTEHGAIMAAAVLNTAQAVETSVFVVRAFVQLRRLASGNGELSVKLTDLSATLELALVEQLRRSRAERWLAENKDGIAAYNALVDPHGAFADTVRTF